LARFIRLIRRTSHRSTLPKQVSLTLGILTVVVAVSVLLKLLG
jgi:uncharacterized membrane protein YidH (DUF202 family)